MKKRVRVYYAGAVQGVGFRFTVERVAIDFDLTGWVRNLFDGRVEIVCEGEESNLRDFLNRIKNGPLKHYITDAQVTWQEATGEFTDFTIRF